MWLVVDNDSKLSNHSFSTWLQCDKMDTLMFCVEEIGNGNSFFLEFLIEEGVTIFQADAMNQQFLSY